MSKDNIWEELPESEGEYVYVRAHYRRRPRRSPSLVDPITEKEMCRRFMMATLEQRR